MDNQKHILVKIQFSIIQQASNALIMTDEVDKKERSCNSIKYVC